MAAETNYLLGNGMNNSLTRLDKQQTECRGKQYKKFFACNIESKDKLDNFAIEFGAN